MLKEFEDRLHKNIFFKYSSTELKVAVRNSTTEEVGSIADIKIFLKGE